MKNKIKKEHASWHQPTLGCDCPYCGEWEDYYKQWVEHEYPFDVCKSAEREELEDIIWICPKCKKGFEFERVEW